MNKKIVFCTGSYDILHSSHAVFFDQCKEFGDILIVGIGRDSIIKKLKGENRPINPENNRIFLLAAMQNIDFVVLNDSELLTGKIDFFNIIIENSGNYILFCPEFSKGQFGEGSDTINRIVHNIIKPDIFVLNVDDSAIKEKKELCEKLGSKLKLVPRIVPNYLKPTSSTKIINKIRNLP